MKNNVIYIGIVLSSLLLLTSFSIKKPVKTDVFTVVLDAGHGGKDGGNLGAGNKYREKNVALNIVLEIGKILEKQPEIKVVYTRKTDVFVDLYKRGEIANRANADLFVSVHCNAHTSQAYGTETFVLGLHGNKQNFEVAKKENEVIYMEDDYQLNYEGFDINSPESMIGLTLMQEEYLDQSINLASMIQKNFKTKLKRKDRSVKQAAFIVLHQTYMPSVLVETGFLTNTSEGKYLNSTKGQQALAKSIASAIMSYKSEIDEFVGDQIFDAVEEEVELVEEETTADSSVLYKIQLAASKKSLDTKAYNFKGLSPISKEKYKDFYRYLYGSTSDYKKAKQLQKKASETGYESSYIVAYKDGVKIPINQAIKAQQKESTATSNNGR
ncbi:N-acetylmuramoyl-L-alanine amidase family protein [Spongiivirga citrea]|uniref:N-acetylmuramoyl-L-alanine amidase n=1 Tax=Spongiivirga citrea TaxID=1481457 RepID=A0A6M0CIV7_9FLAO|nr:N-acetylmuramoyl-L-alanine amidase [Spongiivirga citrea]NER15914.1 N-acetylmuramoyl-L-alanine amidase [Spongiivirga citrea]